MSVTVRSLANGLSGKLQQGDIIQIVSVDEDDKAQIYEELQYVEVLATTSDKGSDDTYRDGEVNADDEDSGEQSLYATVTIILQDRAQALRLAECENTSLHAVFVTRGDEKLKAECLKAQLELLTGEISTAEADGTSEPVETSIWQPTKSGYCPTISARTAIPMRSYLRTEWTTCSFSSASRWARR